MSGFLSGRSQPKREPSTSTPSQSQIARPRPPLVRAANKLKKLFTRPHPTITPIASAPHPLTHLLTTDTTSDKVSGPVLPETMTDISSSGSYASSSPSVPPSGGSSSDSLKSDIPVSRRSETTNPERPPSGNQTIDAELEHSEYPAPSQGIRSREGMPLTTAWRLFTGEVGSVRSSMESSPPTSSVTSEELEILNTRRRARAHRYDYLKYGWGLTEEEIAKRDITRRARARRQAYLTLDRALSTKQLLKRNVERRDRAREYSYLKVGRGLNADALIERDIYRRDCAREDAYFTLFGELP